MENTEKTFLKEQDFLDFKELQDKINQVIYGMGQIAIEKQLLKEKEDKVISNFDKVRNQESNFMRKIERNYGPGIINPDTGEFTKTELNKE